MIELIFRGTFETKNSKSFITGIEQLFKDTDTKFRGQILQFEVDDYTDYEEVINEEMIEQTSEKNDSSNNNESNENQGN